MFATLADLRHALHALVAEPHVDALTGSAAVRALHELGHSRRLVDTLIATLTEHVDTTGAHRDHGDRSASDTCAKALRTTRHEGRILLGAGRTAKTHSRVRQAMISGNLTAAHAALIGDTLDHAPEATDALLAAAEHGHQALRDACINARAAAENPDERSGRQHRSRSLHTWTDGEGMFCGTFRLTPEYGGAIKAILDDGVQRLFRSRRTSGEQESHQAYAADVLVELILGDTVTLNTFTNAPPTDTSTEATAADPTEGSCEANLFDRATAPDMGDAQPPGASDDATPADEQRAALDTIRRLASDPCSCGKVRIRSRAAPTVHIVIDHAALIRGNPLPGERCEIPGVGPVNAQWVRDMLGDAFLTAVIANGKDIHTVSHFGRHINAHLRTALIVQGRECDIAGCTNRGYLEIDHRHDHGQRHPTALWNLHWLCCHHHALKTRGWQLAAPDPVTRKRNLIPPPHAPPQAA